MKQHITVEQLKEVNEHVFAKAFGTEEEVNDLYNPYYSQHTVDNLVRRLSQDVTIGKMIEVLDSLWTKDEIFISRLEDFKWEILFDLENCTEDMYYDYGFTWQGDELVDGLWEAVKYVLSKGE